MTVRRLLDVFTDVLILVALAVAGVGHFLPWFEIGGETVHASAPADSDADAPADSDADAPADPDADAPADSDADAPADPDADAPADPDADTPADPDADTPAGPDADTPADPDADTPADPDADAPADPDADTPADPDADAPADSDADASADPDADAPAESDTDATDDSDVDTQEEAREGGARDAGKETLGGSPTAVDFQMWYAVRSGIALVVAALLVGMSLTLDLGVRTRKVLVFLMFASVLVALAFQGMIWTPFPITEIHRQFTNSGWRLHEEEYLVALVSTAIAGALCLLRMAWTMTVSPERR
jgi:hypothetical protein